VSDAILPENGWRGMSGSWQDRDMGKPTDKYADWLTMGEVQQQTGMSERSVYRRVTAGELRQAERPVPGRKPLPVFHPEDVRQYVAAMVPRVPDGIAPPIPPAAGSTELVAEKRRGTARSADSASNPAFTALAALLAANGGPAMVPSGRRAILPLSELRIKLFLTTEEAEHYTGLNEDYLAKLVRDGKVERIETMRPYRYKRADLDWLLGRSARTGNLPENNVEVPHAPPR
jgi:hypothetical protein